MKQRILILTGNHLCHNPRVIKEASALQNTGYDVEVLGGWSDPALKARDQELIAKCKFKFRPLRDLTAQPALRLWLRLRGRAGHMLHAKAGYENRWQLGYVVTALTRAARKSKADLLIAHSEQALWAIHQIGNWKSEIGNRKICVGVDMEDWFSEDLLPDARKNRPVKLLRRLEQGVLKHSVHSTCTSQAMSEALAKEYGCRPPAVVYNAFPWADRQRLDGLFKDRKDRRVPSIHWYSQTLGAGRGLEELFAALPHVQHVAEIHLRGNAVNGFKDWLMARLPELWRPRVFVHKLVSNDELLSRIAEHDIGFAGEQKYCRSRDLTVTNKILHYLLAGLAVVASDTAGQREVAGQSGDAVRLYPCGDSVALAVQLNELLAAAEKLSAAKAAALHAAETQFCWERMAPELMRTITPAFS